jgi:hypothetical protein
VLLLKKEPLPQGEGSLVYCVESYDGFRQILGSTEEHGNHANDVAAT